MIDKIRFRFIRFTMLTVLAVLALIITTINFINLSRNTQSLDSITQRIMENQIFLIEKPNIAENQDFDFSGFNRGLWFPFQNEKELSFSARFFTIRLDKDNEIIAYNLRRIASVTEEDLEGVKNDILRKRPSVGWYHSYRYRICDTDGGHLLIILEASQTYNAMFYVLYITLLVGLISFAVLFIIVFACSKYAIHPIAETYEKQRQFITDASHELKTPLTIISANTEILFLECGDNDWYEGIARQIKTMHSLIQQMIQLAKLDEGDTLSEFERFDLSEAACDTAMPFHALAERRGLR